MMKSIIKRVIVAILLCVLVFSVAKIITYFEQKADSEHMQSDIIHEHVTPNDSENTDPAVSETEEPQGDEQNADASAPEEEEQPVESTEPEEDRSDASAATEEEQPQEEQSAAPTVSQAPVSTGGSAVAPADGSDGVTVDFASLTARYPDVVGYIYSPGTRIQYPIAYMSSTNDYYLNRDLDGNLNANGSIFIEHLCDPYFGNQNTIIYGHHMKSGLMFADLCKYKDASYYASHPYIYIYTPTQNYRLDLFAGFVCAHDDEVFALSLTQEQLSRMAAKSTFTSNIGIPTGKVVSLVTCSYEFSNARYVVVGALNPM